jgi:hypothetical protein
LGPVAVTFSGCGLGVVPTAPLKLKGDGVVMSVTLNVTATVGLFVEPAALSAMLPILIPAGTPDGLAFTAIVAGVVPVAGLTESQFPVLDAVAVTVTAELVEVVTERLPAAGVEQRVAVELTHVKVNDEGWVSRLNEAGLTKKLTFTVSGEFEVEVKTVTVPV